VHGRPVLSARELDGQPVRLDQGEMLDETTERHLAGRRGRAKALVIEPGRLPGECPAVALEDGEQGLGLAWGNRQIRPFGGFAHNGEYNQRCCADMALTRGDAGVHHHIEPGVEVPVRMSRPG
jgi:hypothetical protein